MLTLLHPRVVVVARQQGALQPALADESTPLFAGSRKQCTLGRSSASAQSARCTSTSTMAEESYSMVCRRPRRDEDVTAEEGGGFTFTAFAFLYTSAQGLRRDTLIPSQPPI